MVSSNATTVTQYLKELDKEKREIVSTVRDTLTKHLPKGIDETIDWGMINYEIPLSTFPITYNKKPLSVMALAAQKHHFALYLHGVYCDQQLETHFREDVIKEVGKINMGKSCLRFKSLEDFPFQAVVKVVKFVTAEKYSSFYTKIRG